MTSTCTLGLAKANHRRGAMKSEAKVPHTSPRKMARENICKGSAPKVKSETAPMTTVNTV